jgi:hypothetical protein
VQEWNGEVDKRPSLAKELDRVRSGRSQMVGVLLQTNMQAMRTMPHTLPRPRALRHTTAASDHIYLSNPPRRRPVLLTALPPSRVRSLQLTITASGRRRRQG